MSEEKTNSPTEHEIACAYLANAMHADGINTEEITIETICKYMGDRQFSGCSMRFTRYFQPERSKREDLPLENDGRIEIQCQRRDCGATLLIRAYSKDKGTHFCPVCWLQLYHMRDLILDEAERHKKPCPSRCELEKILIADLIKYGEMRCSELVRQVREG